MRSTKRGAPIIATKEEDTEAEEPRRMPLESGITAKTVKWDVRHSTAELEDLDVVTPSVFQEEDS